MSNIEFDENVEFNDDDVFGFTEWGCLYSVLSDYGIDVSHIPGRVGKHIVEDFMEMMVEAGYVARNEED